MMSMNLHRIERIVKRTVHNHTDPGRKQGDSKVYTTLDFVTSDGSYASLTIHATDASVLDGLVKCDRPEPVKLSIKERLEVIWDECQDKAEFARMVAEVTVERT